tara:strand:+ start:4388 stop:5155 length:768 start_codon:yes stop_codon:yes gene_type:complete
MNTLDKILKVKREEVEESNVKTFKMDNNFQVRSLENALSDSKFSIIAEIKTKSPSEGEIADNVNHLQIAKDYESAGASAISILTDNQFFGGNIDLLNKVRSVVSIPVLRKDFIIDKSQIYDSFVHKADAILLIHDAMKLNELKLLINYADKIGLEYLLEFHDLENIKYIKEIVPRIIGINSRDLKTMITDLNIFKKSIPYLPTQSIKVAESGLSSGDDVKYVRDLGFDAALIGTSLMKNKNPGGALEKIIKELAL